MNRPAVPALLAAALLAGCSQGPPPPVSVDTRNDACSWCRMAVSDARFAAQIVAPGEEPRIFDDIGCLRSYVAAGAGIGKRALAYVADHRTRSWVPASRAVYTEVPGLATPMASGLVAHSDGASRDMDPDAAGGTVRDAREVFGAQAPPGGGP